MKLFNNLLIIAALFLALSCDYTFPEPLVDNNDISVSQADLSNAVFLGGSMLSAIEDGAISHRSAQYSVPTIFAQHFNRDLDISTFTPYFNSVNGFNIFENQTLNDNLGNYRVFFPSTSSDNFSIEIRTGEPLVYNNAEQLTLKAFTFPQAQTLDFTESGRVRNKYMTSFYNDNSQNIVDKALAQNPSFFVLDFGMDDILGGAINGAEGSSNTTDLLNSTYADILDEVLFAQKLQEISNALFNQNSEAKGVILNIPNLLDFPFFIRFLTDIKLTLDDNQALLAQARAAALTYNQKLNVYYNQNPSIPFDQRRPALDFAPDLNNWGILIEDKSLHDAIVDGETLPKVRHATLDEMVFYPRVAISDVDFGVLPSTAVSESQALKLSEIQLIKDKIEAFNLVIANTVAQSNGRLALVDLNSLFAQLMEGHDRLLGNTPQGTFIDGVLFQPTISKFGIFSADGISLNPAGNALIVNQIIKTINEAFGGELNLVDSNDFPATPFEID